MDVIKEVQTSNRFILKRLNQIVNGPASCTCSCHSSVANKELEILKQRLQDYEEDTKQRDREMQSLRAELQELKDLFDNGQTSDTPHFSKTEESLPLFKNEVSVKSLHPPDIYSYHASIEHTFSETRDSDKEPGENAAEKKWTIHQSEQATNADKGGRHESEEELLDEARQKTEDEHSTKKKVRFRRTPDKEDGMQEKEGPDTGKTVTGTLREMDKDNSDISTSDFRELSIDFKRESDPINKQDIDNEQDDRKRANKVQVADDSNQGKDTMTTADDDVGEAHGTSQDRGENDEEAKAKQDVPEKRKESVKENFNGASDKKHIAKANFQKKSLSESLGVRIVEQTEKRTINFMDWHMAASREQLEGQMSGLATLKGVFTIVVVDISYSMTQGNAWEQAKTFFRDFIDGLKESMSLFNLKEESVALVTFGHKTEVLKRLTNDFTSLQMSFDGLSLGGPSPMYGGLLLSTAAAQTTLCVDGAVVNGIPVVTKFVIITDGFLTDTNLVAGPDILTPSEQDETHSQVLEVMQKMERRFDVFVVPVGNSNTEFLELMRTVSDGKMLTYKDGKRLGTRLRKTLMAGEGKLLEALSSHFGHQTNSVSDEEDIKDILESAEKRSKHRVDNQYRESDSGKLPTIGSRVRRGPDWRWDNQDNNGPGTVIGHAENDEQIWIEWDNNGKTNVYIYHASGGYDVLIVDEPRMRKPNGQLAVGCVVKPGKHWKQTTRNVKVTDRGAVIKILDDEKVQVRWENKERGDYSAGLNGQFEVEFCPPDKVAVRSQGYTLQPTGAQGYVPESQTRLTNKNKNKNAANKNVANKNISNKNKS